MLNKILNMWFVGSFHVFPVLKIKIAHAIAAHPARRSRYACRRGNSSNPKRRRASRCALAASPCRRRCRGRFCRELCCSCQVRLYRLRQSLSCGLMQLSFSCRLSQPGFAHPTHPVCRRYPGQCVCMPGRRCSPTSKFLVSCRRAVASSPYRKRGRGDRCFW